MSSSTAPVVVPSQQGFILPFLLGLGLFVPLTWPNLLYSKTILYSLLVTFGCSLLWLALLFWRSKRIGIHPSFTFSLRKQHYIQAMVQSSVFLYWGYYWRPVYDHIPLIIAQLFFAYLFDILVNWSRRNTYSLGFGPFPIIFSINLFLWFKPEWFYLQFVMIAVGILGKEFIRWNRPWDGEIKNVHIFNPSAFALGLFSLLLIITGTTELTWGQEIASTLTLAPNIYLFLFVVGLVVMYFFSITLVAMVAAATLFGLSALYAALNGVPYFIDSDIPAAVFLGLHLLITDPSTSPRTLLGKAFFGLLYGLGVFALYALLTAMGVPTFYDKLLCVPLLNLSVIAIDRIAATFEKRNGRTQTGFRSLYKYNLAFMAIWLVLFGSMALLGKIDSTHQGDQLPFWHVACEENRQNACKRLQQIEQSYCEDGSAWACNEIGVAYRSGKILVEDQSGNITELANGFFSRSCELRFQAACQNLLHKDSMETAQPKILDLRLILREGGQNLMTMEVPQVLERACKHGWAFACMDSQASIAK